MCGTRTQVLLPARCLGSTKQIRRRDNPASPSFLSIIPILKVLNPRWVQSCRVFTGIGAGCGSGANSPLRSSASQAPSSRIMTNTSNFLDPLLPT